MIDGTTETTEIQITNPPLQQVGEFVTRVWEHPLLDQQTVEFRQTAKNKLADILTRNGFNPDNFITIPVGSLLWATDNKSDFDYILVFSNPDDRDRYLDPPGIRLDLELKQNHIDIVADEIGEHFTNLSSRCTSLLLTPDDYIGGNITLANNLRVRAVEQMKIQKYGEDDWQHEVGKQFDILFRKWDDTSSKISQKFRSEKQDPARNRTQRISDRLEIRANQTHVPEKYKEAFNNARNLITLPNLETYSKAMRDSFGTLSLLPRFSAQGI